ncbi:MAG: chemotaxis protein CheW [Bdellovibrionota bacterium]
MKHNHTSSEGSNIQQYSTFIIANHLYGINVMQVQEIVKAMKTTQVPLAKNYVHGLINLRGQVATAIELRKLLNIHEDAPEESMNVVCRVDGNLISFMVDKISDVIEVSQDEFEPPPNSVPKDIKDLMVGVYKLKNELLSIIDVESIINKISA